jgi:sodium transport system permease protein
VLSIPSALALWASALALSIAGAPLFARLGLGGIALSEILCIAVPTLLVARVRGAPAAILRLARPRPLALAGAALVGASAWVVLATVLLPLQERIAPAPPELDRALEEATRGPLLATLAAAALAPAVCEELLCRGALLFALRPRLGRAGAVLGSALLFALLHLSPYRLLPTFALGALFGAIALASGSIFPSMLAHALNNAAILVAGLPAAQAFLDAHALSVAIIAVMLLTTGIVAVSLHK